MGCICGTMPRKNQIMSMQTRNRDEVFTSTEDIQKIYIFGKVLGVGSFGKVIAAKMKSNPLKRYAIKIIEKRKVKGREDILANEIFILQKLDHPNIIKFHEVYQNKVNFYICMDYCQGGELVDWIPKKYKNFHESNIQEIMRKIISAIAYIHDQGIVHRDIKAENIMITNKNEDAEPKLIDFGLANKFDSTKLRRLKSFVGTPMYMAPEVIQGKYDEKCDIWSLGVLLFTLLSGHMPFHGETKEELYDNIQRSNIGFNSNSWKFVSSEAKDIIRRMLQKGPQLRPSAKTLLKHDWFKKKLQSNEKIAQSDQLQQFKNQISSSPSIQDNRSIYEMLQQNSSKGGSKFRKEVMTLLVKQLNEQELHNLIEKFKQIDTDNSGTITIFELHKALIAEGSSVSQEEIEKLIQNITPKHNQIQEAKKKSRPSLELKYSEFLASCIDERKFLTREKLWSLFKFFDTDNSNFITKDDIKEAFARNSKAFTDGQIDEMIAEIDPNHDNKISFEEFCQMFDNAGIYQNLADDDEIME
ncbi:unnamed protein product [Paramecium pentaurelia]|uniref:Protein kinase domain containing protein n=1 Tax=Paramecium pentaurelia TaxID=43138 RepID=A0A8S1T9V0_9CILI|nr:unnamed protein product [Paramecium pentaurelia]